MKSKLLFSLLGATCVLAVVSAAQAAETRRSCNRSANTAHRQCVSDCKTDQSDALLLCTAIGNPDLQECLKACMTDKDKCLEPYQETASECHDACFAAFDAAMVLCDQGDCQQGNSLQCQICRLTAKLTRFECGKSCADAFDDTRDERQTCRKTFRSCVRTCRSTNKGDD